MQLKLHPQTEGTNRSVGVITIIATLATLTINGFAGTTSYGKATESLEEPPPEATPYADWCTLLKSGLKLYSNTDNPLIQEFKLMGRLQYQLATVDGTDSFGDDVGYDTDEFRRVRLGASLKALNHFQVKASSEIVVDNEPRGGDRGFRFNGLWDGYVKLNAKSAFNLEGFDALKIGYGRREVHMTEEWNTSSKLIKTVERSAIANKVWPSDSGFSNPTGFWVEGTNGELSWQTGAFTTSRSEWLAPWDDGQLYYLMLDYDLSDRTGLDQTDLLFMGSYQDVDIDQDRLAGGVEWATSVGARLANDRWQLRLNATIGDNGDQSSELREDTFWGFVVLPTYWLVQDKFEAVFRYQYQGSSEDQGIRLNSRYVRRAQSTGDANIIGGARGDEHHSFYGGLNYYFCGDNAKIMAGIEYDDISSDGHHVYDGWTGFLAFRLYF
ncbi:MAG: OprO/OprP family phosphate-selective porin [Verrucomicrobiales bacterium]|nr:OprO/OprP family phosphate-selective porin [Verrucomicrobiales bacterium]